MPKIFTTTKTLDAYITANTEDPAEAEYLIIGSRPVDMTPFKKLKGIFKCGVGTDNLPDTDVPIIFPSHKTKEVINNEVAAFTTYLILKLCYRDLGTVIPWVRSQRQSMLSKNALVIGGGKIGTLVEASLHDICNVEVYDKRYSDPETFEESVREADIISMHVPYNDETHEFLDPNLLKKDAILINTARGKLVNEDALYDWLSNNPKAQAAFDVYWNEPYTGKLLNLSNFHATPHIASTCDQFLEGLYNDFLELIKE